MIMLIGLADFSKLRSILIMMVSSIFCLEKYEKEK